MKRSRFLSFLLALAAGVGSGLPVASLSDDTEVYVGSEELAQVQGVRPNVLIILDTSGSMSTIVPDTGKNRLENMKEALQSILDGLNNVNVGLMRFSNPGGPILLPIAHIDADATDAFKAAGADIVVSIADGLDDVEELVKTGEMDFRSSRIELLDTPAFGPEQSLELSVSDSEDDVEELEGAVNTLGLDMRMVTDRLGSRIDGLIFRNLPLARNASILTSQLKFTASSSDSSDSTLEFRGWATDDASSFSGDLGVSSKPRTRAALLMSGMAPWTTEQVYSTEDLSPVVQEIVDGRGWAAGNDIGIIVTGTGLRRAKTYDSGAPARLAVTYGTGSPGEQRVGLHFRNLGIPQGATIDSAVLEVSPSRTLSDSVSFRIYGEDVADATPFSTEESVSKKLARRTSANVTWKASSEWVARTSQGPIQTSPDLAPVLQEIVDRGDWCGGNDIALLIENKGGSGWRAIYSYDGDPGFAPVLKVNYTYDPATAPATTGCVVRTLQRQVSTGADDAEQNNENGRMRLSDPGLDMPNSPNTAQTVGLRFHDLQIDRGTKILDARLLLTASESDSTEASMVFYGEAADNAGTYAQVDFDLRDRPRTSASVTWNESSAAWTSNNTYASPNLKTVVQEVLNRAGWQAGNALSLIVVPGSGQRRAYSYDGSPGQAPTLKITYEGRASATSGPSLTVRQLLKQTVGELDHGGYTPIVDTLYEAARYYRGEGVFWGKTRGSDGWEVERSTRLSHPSSYSGGTIVRAQGCTDVNLDADVCRTERIEGNAQYISPVRELCGANYIILLTDGEANNNHSVDLVKAMTRVSACEPTLSDGTNVNRGPAPDPSDECGIDLGRFLYTRDQLAGMTGTQTVSTYTIGFNLDPSDPAQVHAIQFLKDLAAVSGGQFRTAYTAAELTATFQAFFLDILNRSTSYAAPALSVNAFNKLYHRDEVYLSLFQPSDRIRWAGNIKKYRLCQSAADGCELGSLLDASEPPKPTVTAGRIDEGARDYWNRTEIPDGSKITKGGAGNAGPIPAARKVLTFTGGAAPGGDNLGDDAHELVDTNTRVVNSMLGLDAAASTEARSALIEWVRGVDVDQEEEDASGDSQRYSFADPLHSSPQAVTYGGTDEEPVTKLFVGTNDGALRMINAVTGEEEWIFFPPETLSLQARLRENPNGRHVYGIDGTPTVWVKDSDGDGTIGDSSDDFVRVFVGMRRGGNHYYALDVTPASPLSDPQRVGAVYPTYMWRIDGGSADYPQLGQTWSRPVVATVRAGARTAGQSVAREVLLFAGGYDEAQDDAFASEGDQLGNALYIANPLTGKREYWISGTAHSDGAGVQVPGMDYPIPSDLALMDSDGDGATDRIYVGDTGGQLWRIDLAAASGTEGGVKAVVGKLATVSSDASDADKRKFFYPPDVVQVLDTEYSNVARYDLVTIASGDREHPLSVAVADRLYAFRDLDYGPMRDTDANGLADSYPSSTAGVALQGPLDGPPATAGDLFDATNVPQIDDGGTTNLTALQQSEGWYLRFEQPGEKGLASPIVLAGKLFVTTFTPEATLLGDVCQLMEGRGRLYGLNVLSAEPLFNWGKDLGITGKDDRVYQLAAGIPSEAIPIFHEEGLSLLIGVGGGAETVDPGIGRPRAPTYWFQEQ